MFIKYIKLLVFKLKYLKYKHLNYALNKTIISNLKENLGPL